MIRDRLDPGERDHLLSGGLILLLLLATLDEGGAGPSATLSAHLLIVALSAVSILRGPLPGASALPACGPPAAFTVFLGLAVAGAAAAPYGYAAFTLLLELAAFLGVALLAARSGRSFSRTASGFLLAGAGAQGVLALYQKLFEDAARPAATFLNPNHMAAWLVAVLLLGLANTPVADGIGAAVRRIALALPAVAAVGLAGSRGALLGLAAGGSWLVAVRWRGMGRWARRGILALAGAVLLVAVVGVALRSGSYDPFRYQRVRIWRASLAAAMNSPWTGVGPRQWSAAANNLTFPVEEGPLRYERYVDATHSDLLRLPCEFGWPAALAALVGLGLAIRRIARSGPDPGTAGAVAALLALGTHALVANLSERPAIYLLAAALLGSLLAGEGEARGERPATATRVGLVGILVLVFLLGDLAPYRAWQLSRELPAGRLEPGDADRLEAALALNPVQPALWLRRAEHLAGEAADRDARRYAPAREAAERAVRLQPADASVRVRLARIERLAFFSLFGDEASRARVSERYDQAAELARHDPFLPLEHGEFLLDAGDPGGARRLAERSLAIEPNCIPSRLLAADALLAAGSPGSEEHVARLLAEAEKIARQWRGHARRTSYARQCLSLDEDRVRRIRAAIGSLHGPDQD